MQTQDRTGIEKLTDSIVGLREIASGLLSGKLRHRYAGDCPDDVNGPTARDPHCPACRALMEFESTAAPRPKVFVDLDGVVVDFDRYKRDRGMTGDQIKKIPGAYFEMPAIPGAIEAVRSVIGMGYEVWIATKPPTGIPDAYAGKAAWVCQHLPELKRRIIITHDKGLLGSVHDYLCDDRPHKANCEAFAGTLLRFVDGFHWPQALEFLRDCRPQRGTRG